MNATKNAAGVRKQAVLAGSKGLLLGLLSGLPLQDTLAERPVDGIQDNSFLVEEAYNQEAGVVQHIFTGAWYVEAQDGPDDQIYALNLTQEWPVFSQRHQFSYTVPYLFVERGGDGANGFGDVLLNYRFQAWFDPESLRAVAPRLSLVLPTGRSQDDLGDDTVGVQFNLPASAAWGDRWFTHVNAGVSWLPDAVITRGSDAVHWNLGASAIYAVSSDFHLMLEWTGNWLEVADAPGAASRHEFATVVAPGFRYALNLPGDAQLVLGLAAPIGLNADSPDVGVLLYASFEHFFQRPRTPSTP